MKNFLHIASGALFSVVYTTHLVISATLGRKRAASTLLEVT